jgi:hypothetical protein
MVLRMGDHIPIAGRTQKAATGKRNDDRVILHLTKNYHIRNVELRIINLGFVGLTYLMQYPCDVIYLFPVAFPSPSSISIRKKLVVILQGIVPAVKEVLHIICNEGKRRRFLCHSG